MSDFFFDDKPYKIERIHPEDKKTLDEMTKPRNWESLRIRQVLISLGTVGGGISVPSYNRPDTIEIKGWHDIVEDLSKRSKELGVEHSRPLFVDARNQKLQFANKICVGTHGQVITDWTPPDTSRSRDFARIGLVHTHPSGKEAYLTAHGFSGSDFISLLSNPEQQVSMISYGDNNRILLLKTSVTPNNLSAENIRRDIKVLEDEFLGKLKTGSVVQAMQSVVDFNKAACTEYGLTMYVADKNSNDTFKRVNVAN